MNKNFKLGLLLAVLSFSHLGCGNGSDSASPGDALNNRMVPIHYLVGDDPSNSPTESSDTHLDFGFRLADSALILTAMDELSYQRIQKKWVGSTFSACNFFLITSLCEAGYCQTSKPFYKAGDFDIYLAAAGFQSMSLNAIKSLFKSHASFDLVFQKKNPIPSRSGHVMVGVGYDEATDQIRIADGNLGKYSREVRMVSDDFITQWEGGFRIFVRR